MFSHVPSQKGGYILSLFPAQKYSFTVTNLLPPRHSGFRFYNELDKSSAWYPALGEGT